MTQDGYTAWGQSYSIGVPIIDNQHKNLFLQINLLLSSIKDESIQVNLRKSILFLQQYVEAHFGTEERLMQNHNFSGLNFHKKEHEYFIKKLHTFSKEYENSGVSKDLKMRLAKELWVWFKEHVMKTDLKLGDFLKSKNVHKDESPKDIFDEFMYNSNI
ncbi:bacteriohemerythrin [candidate division KSB1 bacterium]